MANATAELGVRPLKMGSSQLKFEWDNKKAASNQRKHGVTFEEASTVLSDFLSITVPDPLHLQHEERFATIGVSDNQRLLVVIHTDTGIAIRIISARLATLNERKRYEKYGH
jgi:uncharacterized DUF497 family protein